MLKIQFSLKDKTVLRLKKKSEMPLCSLLDTARFGWSCFYLPLVKHLTSDIKLGKLKCTSNKLK